MNKQTWNRKQKHWSSVLALIGVIGGLALVSDDGLIPVANAQDDLVYVPLDAPCRVVNTRNTGSTHLIASASRDFFSYGAAFTIGDQGGSNAGCDHPRSAEGIQPAAMAANVTAVGKQASGNGNITAYPAGSGAPSASTVNYTPAANIANSTLITLRRSDGSFTLLSNNSDVPVVVDVVGYFYDAPDRTAALCELYQVLFDGGMIGALPVPEFCSQPTTYAIGETGPAGGIVIYTTNGGLNGLEAAPVDQAFPFNPGAAWGCNDSLVLGADGIAVGTGAQNTADILAGCPDRPIAASVAAEYAGPNQDSLGEWFLPSRNELNEIHMNQAVVGGLSSYGYWSSSKYNDDVAWAQVFGDGFQGGANKDYKLGVRAVRAF